MSIKVEPNHPLAEILACKLSGIQVVPQKEMAHMVNRAIKAAVEWANGKEAEIKRLKEYEWKYNELCK